MHGVRVELTVTLVFTDIVDSTSVNARLGDSEMRALWDAHDGESRTLLRRWNGTEIDRSDGFLAVFQETRDSAAFIADYHQMLGALPTPLKARAGVHRATVVMRRATASDVELGAKPWDVVGIAKAFCSRIMTLATAGQTLASAEAIESLGLGAWASTSHGHWRLKGIEQPVELFEIGNLDATFVPPVDGEKAHRVVWSNGLWIASSQVPRSLPSEGDEFFGRQSELRDLSLLASQGHALITITGAGGIGKTRLALRYAWGWLGTNPGGVYFCDVSQATGIDGIASAVARAFDLPLGADPISHLGSAIAGHGNCLIVLDNFEQVVAHAAQTIGVWLGAAHQVRFIVTSRERLGIPSEHILSLEPLTPIAAVALFNDRALAARQGYKPEDMSTVMLPLVELLDRLPLALELAAARVSVVSPSAMLTLIGDRFRLLASRNGRPSRQATLHATLDWSWELLSEGQRCSLANLSVFEGWFSAAAAAAIMEIPSSAGAAWTVDALHTLLDKSLLRAGADGLFGLLRCIKEFAGEKLRTRCQFPGFGPDAEAATFKRHHAYHAALTEEHVTANASVELDDLVLACRSATRLGNASVAVNCLRLAWTALRLLGPFTTAIDMAAKVRTENLSSADAAVACWVQASALYASGAIEDSGTVATQGLSFANVDSDSLVLARLHCCMGEVFSARGDGGRAAAHLAQANHLATKLAHVSLQCQVLNAMGALAGDEGRIEDARRAYHHALAIAEEASESRWQAAVLGNMAVLMMAASRYDEALDAAQRSLAHAHRSGDRRWAGNAHCNLGLIHCEQGSLGESERNLTIALGIARQMGHRALEFTVLCNLGLVSERRGDLLKAYEQHLAAVNGAELLGDVRVEAQFRACLGSLQARLSRHVDARACLAHAQALLVESSDDVTAGMVLCSVAENELLSGGLPAATKALDGARTSLRACGGGAQSELGRRVEQVAAQLASETC